MEEREKFNLHFCVICSYNQQEEDFSSLREYNDYLEEVETIGEHTRHSAALSHDGMCSVQFVSWCGCRGNSGEDEAVSQGPPVPNNEK